MSQPLLKMMIPGPIQPADDVLAAMGEPIQPHTSAEFVKYYHATTEQLRPIFNTQGNIFLMVGTGSTANDAGIGTAFSTGDKVIVGTNGFFGDRLITIAESYGLRVVPVRAEWGQPLLAANFEAAFRNHPDAVGVAAVHLETSTTVVNPIPEIGQICRDRGAFFMVDAVSSLGGLPVKMDEWGIGVCGSASQKCLGGPPGLAPVAVSPAGWEWIDRSPDKGHGWYSDLRFWRKYAVEWAGWHPFPITMTAPTVKALHTSLERLLAEGLEASMERYRRLALRLRAGLRSIGMTPFTPDEALAPVLTAAYVPVGSTSGQVTKYLAEIHHIQIASGLGALKDQIIRIGHMSPTIAEADIDEVVAALAGFRPA